MFGDQKYLHDNTFRRVVDSMRSLLSMYHVTPGELREAAIVAATMHESENIRPLFVYKYNKEATLYGGVNYPVLYMDEAKNIPPAMFGGICATARTASGATTGRIPSDGSTVTHADKYKCICGSIGTLALHTQTCKDYNWSVTHPSRFTEHVFGKIQSPHYNPFRVCVRCNLSDVYTKDSTEPCKGSTERRKITRRVAVSDVASNKRGIYTRSGKDRRSKS